MLQWRRAGTTLSLSLFLSAAPASAAVSSAGDWEMIKSVHGQSGAIYQVGDFELAFSLSDPFLAVSSLTASADSLRTGYLSQLPSTVLSPQLSAMSVSSTNVASGSVVDGVSPQTTVSITFNTEVSTQSLAAGLVFTAVQDAQGNSISTPQPFTVTFSSATNSLSIVPTGPLPKGTLFSLTLSTNITDINGVPLALNATVSFITVRDFSVDNVIRFAGEPKLSVSVGANTFSEDFKLSFSTGFTSDDLSEAAAKLKRSLGADRVLLKTVKIEPFTADGELLSSDLTGSAVLSIPFSDLNADGIVDGTDPPVRTKAVSVFAFDEELKLFVRLPGASFDSTNGKIGFSSSRFRIFVLVGQQDLEVEDSYAFPSVFRPGANDPARYGSYAGGIKFTNLPAGGSIRIYTVSGILVRDIIINANPVTWDVKNFGGQRVASGLYIWQVKSNANNRKSGRIMIIQ